MKEYRITMNPWQVVILALGSIIMLIIFVNFAVSNVTDVNWVKMNVFEKLLETKTYGLFTIFICAILFTVCPIICIKTLIKNKFGKKGILVNEKGILIEYLKYSNIILWSRIKSIDYDNNSMSNRNKIDISRVTVNCNDNDNNMNNSKGQNHCGNSFNKKGLSIYGYIWKQPLPEIYANLSLFYEKYSIK